MGNYVELFLCVTVEIFECMQGDVLVHLLVPFEPIPVKSELIEDRLLAHLMPGKAINMRFT